MAGINKTTGKSLDGWEHTWQSILDIFTTPIGTRVMRRDYGSLIPTLIDRPGTQERVVDVVMAAAEALDKWEPRFALDRGSIEDAGPDGVFQIVIVGRYFPRGHLGDFSIFEDERTARIPVRAYTA